MTTEMKIIIMFVVPYEVESYLCKLENNNWVKWRKESADREKKQRRNQVK